MNGLTKEERQWLFLELWNPDTALDDDLNCMTCGEPEGKCDPEVCFRLLVTNKLGLATATFARTEIEGVPV